MVEVANSSEPDDAPKGLGIRCGRMKPKVLLVCIVVLTIFLHIQFYSFIFALAEDEELTIVKKDVTSGE